MKYEDMTDLEKRTHDLLVDMGYTEIHHPAWAGIKNGKRWIAYFDDNNNFIIKVLENEHWQI